MRGKWRDRENDDFLTKYSFRCLSLHMLLHVLLAKTKI